MNFDNTPKEFSRNDFKMFGDFFYTQMNVFETIVNTSFNYEEKCSIILLFQKKFYSKFLPYLEKIINKNPELEKSETKIKIFSKLSREIEFFGYCNGVIFKNLYTENSGKQFFDKLLTTTNEKQSQLIIIFLYHIYVIEKYLFKINNDDKNFESEINKTQLH